MAELTPFQTVGPYLSLGLRAGTTTPRLDGTAIVIRGRLIDGAGQGIPDGVLEWWHPALPVVQRSLTAADGSFILESIKPAAPSAAGGTPAAPHFDVRVLGRGIQLPYITRLYFADEAGTSTDAVLGLVPDSRRHTLIAQREAANEYRFDVIVQGDNETVFFDC